MVWRLFATKLETAETREGVALNMSTPYFYSTSTQKKGYNDIDYIKRSKTHDNIKA
jgi:hypothetical protein